MQGLLSLPNITCVVPVKLLPVIVTPVPTLPPVAGVDQLELFRHRVTRRQDGREDHHHLARTLMGLGLKPSCPTETTKRPSHGFLLRIGGAGGLCWSACILRLATYTNTISNPSRMSLRTKVNLPASSKSPGSSRTANLKLLKAK
jgi:hypothetical protein